MKLIIFTLFILIVSYVAFLITAHSKDNFVMGNDFYWHGEKFVSQPESCSSSSFDTTTGEVKFFGCGEDNNETIVVHPPQSSN